MNTHINLQVTREFNEDLADLVWTVRTQDGSLLLPSEGVQALNFDSEAAANAWAVANYANFRKG